MLKMSRSNLSSLRIPVPTTFVVALDREQESTIHSKLNTTRGDSLVWKIPHAPDAAHWNYGFLRNIQNHINNGRFGQIKQLFIVGSPNHHTQTRILNRVCPRARVFFVGPNLKTSLPDNGKERNIINAIRYMERYGHHCEIIDPATKISRIVQKILAKPAHQDGLANMESIYPDTSQLLTEYYSKKVGPVDQIVISER